MTLMISRLQRLVPCAMAVLLAACAPLTVPPQTEHPVGRARLVLPAGEWQDLGRADTVAPGSDGRLTLETRAVGLRGAQGEWLAVLRVHTNRTGSWRGSAAGAGSCPAQRNVMVEDAAAGSAVRADCLRLKPWASSSRWLEQNRPDLVRWLADRTLTLRQPYIFLSYRYATEAGAWVDVDALVDQRLVQPRATNNMEFLAAGRPSLQWARDMAQSARLSVAMMDGQLAIPPFPFPTPSASR